MLYVFLDIKLDATHFVDTVRHNFEASALLTIVSTIQFVATHQVCKLFISFCFFLCAHPHDELAPSLFSEGACKHSSFRHNARDLTHMMSLFPDPFRKGLQVFIVL